MIFSDTEPNGVMWWAFCFLLIILIGCGLGWIAKERPRQAAITTALNHEIEAQNSRLEELRDSLQTKNHLWETKGSSRNSETLNQIRSAAASRSSLLVTLKERKAALIAMNRNLEHEFQVYRATAIQQLWEASAGQSLGYLKTKDGKEYSGVVIRRITPSGMEVAHESGRAMIPFGNLSSDLQQRFKWSETRN